MFNSIKQCGYCAIGLNQPKTDYNIGGVLRAAGCYGVAMIAVSGKRYNRHSIDTQAAYKHLPMLQVDNLYDIIPYDCVPIAIELLPNARNLIDYIHPERAFYIFGPEDGTLGKKIIDWCRDVVYIPTRYCMNLACCVNVVLYDRLSKISKNA